MTIRSRMNACATDKFPHSLIAFVIGFPLQWIVTPKTYHSINVWAARASNIPLILLVAAWERREVFTARWQRTRMHAILQRILIRTTAHQAVRIAFHLPAELLVRTFSYLPWPAQNLNMHSCRRTCLSTARWITATRRRAPSVAVAQQARRGEDAALLC